MRRGGQVFQFYGLGVDNLVVGVSMARGGGFIAFGHTLSDPTWKMPWPGTGPYGFIQPNLRNEFLGNTVMEGLRAEHQSSPLGSGALGVQLQFGGHAFAIVDGVPESNRYIVFRGNHALSNGGFFVGGCRDVLLEGNTVNNTPSQSVSGEGHYHVAQGARGGVYLVGNK